MTFEYFHKFRKSCQKSLLVIYFFMTVNVVMLAFVITTIQCFNNKFDKLMTILSIICQIFEPTFGIVYPAIVLDDCYQYVKSLKTELR